MIDIFISYRHDDVPETVRSIDDYLCAHFDADTVKIDYRSTEHDIKQMMDHVRTSDVLLVVIGRNWINILEEKQNDEGNDDHVRDEIHTGLTTDGVLVIPVIIDDLKRHHPPAQMLPDEIKALAYKKEHLVRDDSAHFENDMAALVARIKERHARYGGALRVAEKMPVELLDNRIAKAKERVRIMCIWSSRWFSLRESLLTAMRRGAVVQVLVLDPANDALCRQRDRDLNEPEGFTKQHIEQNIRELESIAERAAHLGLDRSHFQIKLYSATPSRVLYMVDEMVLIGSHPVGQLSAD
ncbi:MAG: toll/interleukin-1 receptor domain-containing protein, partial [Anaerolineae bacterium]|nr:toll/interleukin-1 receptor domain-containing protein [Anaerolineae bacterium]